jgi:hypothetical protein
MDEKDSSQPAFREEQQFRQVWIWIILILCTGLVWYSSARVLVGEHGGDSVAIVLVIAYWLAFGVGLPALFYFLKLITEVRGDGISVRFYPFHRSFHRYLFDNVERCQIREYKPIKEYGGWGIRHGVNGKAYSVSGHQGVQLELVDGERVLIGSQRAGELMEVIRLRRADKK